MEGMPLSLVNEALSTLSEQLTCVDMALISGTLPDCQKDAFAVQSNLDYPNPFGHMEKSKDLEKQKIQITLTTPMLLSFFTSLNVGSRLNW